MYNVFLDKTCSTCILWTTKGGGGEENTSTKVDSRWRERSFIQFVLGDKQHKDIATYVGEEFNSLRPSDAYMRQWIGSV